MICAAIIKQVDAQLQITIYKLPTITYQLPPLCLLASSPLCLVASLLCCLLASLSRRSQVAGLRSPCRFNITKVLPAQLYFSNNTSRARSKQQKSQEQQKSQAAKFTRAATITRGRQQIRHIYGIYCTIERENLLMSPVAVRDTVRTFNTTIISLERSTLRGYTPP